MKFECGDLDRALAVSDLMPEAREHLKTCANCRREYRLWTDISDSAKELHEEWETPDLWTSIRARLDAEPKPHAQRSWWMRGRMFAIAAGLVLVAGASIVWFEYQRTAAPQPSNTAQIGDTSSRAFLTEQALSEVERTEAAYRESIDHLSRLAEPALRESPRPLAEAYREKLATLDAAITETRANLANNRFNSNVQMELANLYRQKQEALKELLTRDAKN